MDAPLEERDADGVDLTLVRRMMSLTPDERLSVLDSYLRGIAKLLWTLWSPTVHFDEEAYARTADSFDNPDFVDVSVHSYRHRYGYAPGDPRYAATEARLAAQPKISVPTIAVHGEFDDVIPLASSEDHVRFFTGGYDRRVLPVGHNPAREAPVDFAQAILDLHGSPGQD